MKRSIVVHPILFAVYFVLSPLASNIGQVMPVEPIRSLALVLAGSAILWLVFKCFTRDWTRAGLLTSLCIFVFLYFGHVYRLAQSVLLTIRDYPLVFFCAWAALLSTIVWYVWRRTHGIQALTVFLNVASTVALIWPTCVILVYLYFSSHDPLIGWTRPVSASQETFRLVSDAHPDIYYVILDGYGRADLLQESYQFDNSAFIAALVGRGFYVAEKSRSNYSQTALSLASSLNMEYLDYLADESKDSRTLDPLAELIRNNRVHASLRDLGYKTVAISSQDPLTDFRDADIYLSWYSSPFNQFENLLLTTTVAGVFESSIPLLGYNMHRRQILHAFDQLAQVPALESPKFVFAHIFVAHPPFVFGRHGEAVEPDLPYSMKYGGSMYSTHDQYIQAYSNQVLYTNSLVVQAIEAILANSKAPPIIILQGDHGPSTSQDWDSGAPSCLSERVLILNAYYLPDGKMKYLYASITPVNSFRLIFNAFFAAKLSLLEDRSYSSPWFRPYDFQSVPEQLPQCPVR